MSLSLPFRSLIVPAALGLSLAAAACSGSEDASTPEHTGAAVAPELLAASWQVQVAQPGRLDDLLQNPAWGQVYERQFGASIPAFADQSARGHAEAAAIYRQAAALQANAILATFGPEQRRDTDPAQVAYLVGVALVVQGDLEGARAALGKGGEVEEVAAADAAWAEAVAGEFTLAALPPLFELGPVVAGQAPELTLAPHYLLPEGELLVEVADPTMALSAAVWHEAAARQAGGEGWVDAWLAPWRLPIEQASTEGELPLDALFLGPWPTGEDLAFVNALAVDHEAAMGEWPSKSMYASALAACAEDGAVDVDCLLDASVDLGAQLEVAMELAFGSDHVDHRVFASFARSGLLRVGARLCDAQGDERMAAVLRLNARDRGTGAATDPKFLISLAAWDAGKRNALRSTELFHPNRNAVPGLDAVRVSLDTFGLRVGREAGPDIPK